ncbi:MAG TPA: PHP domain-containing protein [Anaerolineales bacterium]|nr:PHP domain-containing protein [Anaerolineales bacterium]
MTTPAADSPPGLWRVELHCHTYKSADSLAQPERLLGAARRKGIQRLAITDHNTTAGALEAYALDPKRIIVGEEILTSEGELLAYYVQEEVPAGLSPEATIGALRDQGAVIGVSHPFDPFRQGAWEPAALRRILPLVDALEILNARTWGSGPNRRAAQWASDAGLPGFAGSDAHAAFEIGAAFTLLEPFSDAPTFLRSLQSARIGGRTSPPWVHLISRYAVWSKRRSGSRP